MKYSKEAKPEREREREREKAGSRAVPVLLMFIVLCAFSFYLGGIYSSGRTFTFFDSAAAAAAVVQAQPQPNSSSKAVVFPECPADYQDYTPCTDPKRWRKYGNYRLSFMERHCPPAPERKECLVPPPAGYKAPIRWPKSKEQCWYRNVPYDWINSQKSNQHWLKKEGDRFLFPGGGTMFPNGVAAYADLMAELVPGMKDGGVRTAIDTGCGVASWGGHLLGLGRGILAMSLAPRDNHEAQVQFALERGIPAILGIISTQRLPFPSAAFDMAHCSRCLIPWADLGGLYLMEVHRLLRPGGFWVLSGPPVNYENRWHGWNTTAAAQKADLDALTKLLASMCFKPYANKGDIAVWQKSGDAACYDRLSPVSSPPRCDDSVHPDAAWYVPMRACINAPNANSKKQSFKWPQRLGVAPERISAVPGGSAAALKQDDGRWRLRVKQYRALLPALGSDRVRNVMDMNTVYGGLAAALVRDAVPVWVMNVVSSYGPNSLALGVVFDRGLVGTNHDWCEAFSTYPRTYDLLHLDGLFTAESHRCEMKFVLLEMDRILRPGGYVIIREHPYFLDAVAPISKGMRWSCHKHDTENKADTKEKLLICQKKFWTPKPTKHTQH